MADVGNRRNANGTDVALAELPIWEAPHTFERGEPYPSPNWDRVFSYGLLLPEIDHLRRDEGLERLASRWGATEVEELKNELIFDLEEGRDTTMQGLPPFVRKLGGIADRAGHVPSGFEESMRRFLDKVRRPDTFVWRWDLRLQQRVRVSSYNSLFQRLGIEYDHLVTRKPRLARCKLCRRVFVPANTSRPERYCRANLWLTVEAGDRRPRREPIHLERCVPLDETERLRTRKRLEQRHRRRSKRHGPRSAEALEAKRALGEWSKRHQSATTGRQPRPQANVIARDEKED